MKLIAKIFMIIGIAIAAFVLIYFAIRLIFARHRIRKQNRDLQKKLSYLNSLLTGQDSQYIHRIEVISRTNLLYSEIHDKYSTIFRNILENDKKVTESYLEAVDKLILEKDYKNIKSPLADAKKSIQIYERKVNDLDEELHNIIKPEEESRSQILIHKENYRNVKQTFFAQGNALALVNDSFLKVFEKLDSKFEEFESHVESAEYSEAQNLIPEIEKVVKALDKELSVLPNICALVEDIIPNKIEELKIDYNDVEKSGVPLFHLGFKAKVDVWEKALSDIRKNVVSLKINGVSALFETIQNEIETLRNSLNQEILDKEYFLQNEEKIYSNVIDLENSFLKIISFLPNVNSVYSIEQDQKDNLETLKENINNLGAAKRGLDNFVHSATKQPYSVLKSKLDALKSDYEVALKGFNSFKNYLSSIKTSSEEAYGQVFTYYYRAKQMESLVREMNIPSLSEIFLPRLDNVYSSLNELDIAVKNKPIDVKLVNDKSEFLKSIANPLFDEIENNYREMKLAESAVVFANRDRIHQSDIHEELSILEDRFFEGDFNKTYQEATTIFANKHVEDADNGSR